MIHRKAMEQMLIDAKFVVREIIKHDDSTIRLVHWNSLTAALHAVIKEEERHNWEIPSPHNPKRMR